MTPGSNKSITPYIPGFCPPCNDIQTCSLVPATLTKAFINFDQDDTMSFFVGWFKSGLGVFVIRGLNVFWALLSDESVKY